MLKVGAVRWDGHAQMLRIVVEADEDVAGVVSISRDALALVDHMPSSERVFSRLEVESFAQLVTADWKQVSTDEVRCAQHWAFADTFVAFS